MTADRKHNMATMASEEICSETGAHYAASASTTGRHNAGGASSDHCGNPWPTEAEFGRFVAGIYRKMSELSRQSGVVAQPQLETPCLFGDNWEPSLPLKTRPRGRVVEHDLRKLVSRAFLSMVDPLPEDHVVVHPIANEAFVGRCRALGATVDTSLLNQTLLNVRKAGWHSGADRGRGRALSRKEWEDFGYASEMAAGVIQRRHMAQTGTVPSVDAILCDPKLRIEFDAHMAELVEERNVYLCRLALLSLRKAVYRRCSPSLGVQQLKPLIADRLDFLDPESVPKASGVYQIKADNDTVFVSSSTNLHARIRSHHRGGTYEAPSSWGIFRGARFVLVCYSAPWLKSADCRRALVEQLTGGKVPALNLWPHSSSMQRGAVAV